MVSKHGTLALAGPRSDSGHGTAPTLPAAPAFLPHSWPWRIHAGSEQCGLMWCHSAASVVRREPRQPAACLSHSRHMSAEPQSAPYTRTQASLEGFEALADGLQQANPKKAEAAAPPSQQAPPASNTDSTPLRKKPQRRQPQRTEAPTPHTLSASPSLAPLDHVSATTAAVEVTPDAQLHVDIQRATKAVHLMNLLMNPGISAFAPSHTAALLLKLSMHKGTPEGPRKIDSANVALNRLLDRLESGSGSGGSSGGSSDIYSNRIGYGRLTPTELVNVLQAASRMPWGVSLDRMQGMVQALLLERGRLLQVTCRVEY